eukprot:1161635-Pelagomonas_calceolata.AAC.13
MLQAKNALANAGLALSASPRSRSHSHQAQLLLMALHLNPECKSQLQNYTTLGANRREPRPTQRGKDAFATTTFCAQPCQQFWHGCARSDLA